MPDKEKDPLNPAEKKYGQNPPVGESSVSGGSDLDKIRNAESEPEKRGSTKQQDNESKKVNPDDEPESKWETLTDNKGRKFRFNRRRAAASGGIFGVLIGGGIGFFGFLAGPLQFIHFAQVLGGFHMSDVLEFNDGRAGKLLRWARTQDSPQDRNLGRLGNKVAVRYENKLRLQGIDFNYNTGARLSSVTIDTKTEAGKKLLANIETDSGVDLTSRAPPDGKVTIDLATDSSDVSSSKLRRSFIKMSVKASDLGGISGAVASRMLKARAAVDFHPLKDIARNADENLRLRYDEYKKKRADSVQDGADPDVKVEATADDPDNPDANSADKEVAGVSEEIAAEAKNTSKPINERIESIKGKLGAGVGVTAVVGLACGLNEIGKSVTGLQESNIIEPLIRTGGNAIAVGSQVMTGQDVNFEELGALSESFYDEENGTSWTEAESILAEQGESGGQPIPASAKPGRSGPAVFEYLDSVISAIPGGQSVCGAISSTFGGIVLTVGGIAATFTGPFAAALSAGSDIAQDQIAQQIIPNVVRWLAGEAVDVANFAGADYGNIANYGTFLAANNQMKGMGGRALTTRERVALNNARQQRVKDEMKTQSFYARVLKPTEPNSLFATTVLGKPGFQSVNSSVASAVKYTGNIFSSLFGSIRSLLPGVGAQTAPFDYGVDEYGFSLDEINNEQENLTDPYKNEDYVVPKLEELNNKYGEKCFGATVDKSGKINYTKAPSYEELEANKSLCANTNDEDLLHYRFYLADMTTMKAITCYESIDESSCGELGLGSSASSNNGSGAGSGITKYSPSLPSTGTSIQPKGITLHWWGSSGNGDIEPLANTLRDRGLSVQFGITSSGAIYQMTASETDQTSHATGANSTTFGIEIDGGPEDFGPNGPTNNPAKFNAVVNLVKYLSTKYNIPTDFISPESLVCGDVVGIHPHKAYNKCGNTKTDIDDAYFNAVMERVRAG